MRCSVLLKVTLEVDSDNPDQAKELVVRHTDLLSTYDVGLDDVEVLGASKSEYTLGDPQ